MKILIPEDTKDIVLSYTTILEDRNHQIIVAATTAKIVFVYTMKNFKRYALKQTLLSTWPFDIVIADYKLPKINGLQVAREILAVSPRQRVILASSHFEDESIDCVYESKG